MFERFTERARRVLVLAQEEARLLSHNYIGTEHILLGLSYEGEGVAAKALEAHGVALPALRAKVEEATPRGVDEATASPPFTPRAKKVLELSLREALHLRHNYIGTEHILLGLLREGEGVGAHALVALGVSLAGIRQTIIELLRGYGSPLLTAVDGQAVERTELPIGAGALLGTEEAAALIGSWTVVDQQVTQTEVDGIVYETYRHEPAGLPPSIDVAVVGARVTREAFDAYTARIDDAEQITGLGDAATYSKRNRSLRVLCGSTVFVVRVARHPDSRAATLAVAKLAVANLPSDSG